MGGPRSSPALAPVRNPSARVVDGVDQAAQGGSPEFVAARTDAIALSARALSLLRAGLAVRAYVMSGWEQVRRIVTFANGRTLVFENGIYR
ncbi:MAG TPA: hypothetical protein VKT51_12050 [Candidatus Eremiobacteraceae bacterium]|nr:hypothetical protein [Candidatus Eremiobacteraceae bacterium]